MKRFLLFVVLIFCMPSGIAKADTLVYGAPSESTALSMTATTGSEKVTNGDMSSDCGTGWTCGANWAIGATGYATHTAGATATLTQDTSEANGENYVVVFSVANASAGSVTMSICGITDKARSTNETFTVYVNCTGTGDLTFTPLTAFNGRIDNVSVKKLTSGTLTVAGETTFNNKVTLSGENRLIVPSGSIAAPSVTFTDSLDSGLALTSAGNLYLIANGAVAATAFSTYFQVAGYLDIGGSADTLLVRTAANQLSMRNSSNAQTFCVYETDVSGANDEYYCIDAGVTTGDTLTVKANTAGTGSDNLGITLSGAGTGVIKTTSPFVNAAQALTIADSGADANPATATLTPTSSYVECTCNDDDNCTITMDETGMVEGAVVTIVSLHATYVCNIDEAANVTALSADPVALAQYDTITLRYTGDIWVQQSLSDN